MKTLNYKLASTLIVLTLTAIQSRAQSTYEPYTFTTLAGNAGYGSADGMGTDARFWMPSGVAVDSSGNVYVADTGNHTIRKITPTGVVTTLAGLAGNTGSVDGTGSAARFYRPSGVTVDSAGSVYVADSSNNTIRKVSPAGMVTTLAGLAHLDDQDQGNQYPVGEYADGTGSAARFNQPSSVAVDYGGNVYVADTYNGAIRKGYPAPRILKSGPAFGFNGGRFGFNLTGPAGRLVVVEASTDLASWLPIWTNTFAGALTFSDPQSGGASNRFYRTHLP